MKIAIIGGGITGLTAAYYVQKELLATGINADYQLYEASERLGGKIETEYRDGFVIEKGPDSFLARKESASRLAKEVGLEGELTHNNAGQAYILKGEDLHPIPGGAVMGIPTRWGPFLSTNLFSLLGKARAAGDLFLPRTTKHGEDLSLGTFFRKRLGSEVVDYLIDPLLSGIYAGDIDNLSLQATFPHFQQMEQKRRSLILGMKSSMAKKQQPSKPKGKSKGMFLTFKRGLQSFVESLENHLDEDKINTNRAVQQIQKNVDGFTLTFMNGLSKKVDRVIVTTPHQVTNKILPEEVTEGKLKDIPSTTVATISMAFDEDQMPVEFNGTGFVVSKKSNYTITACTWTHKKWVHSAPKGKALLRCYVGKVGDEAIVDENDETIVNKVMHDISQVMNIKGQPLFTIIKRWKKAMPQYEVGHKDKMEELNDSIEEKMPGLYLAGASFRGIGLPDCIDQGEQAAKDVLHSL